MRPTRCNKQWFIGNQQYLSMFQASLCPSSGGNILHTSCYPTLLHHNSYNRTDNYRQRNAVGSPDDGHKDARNMLRYYRLPINHYLLHLVGLTFTYLSKMHGHSNIKFFWLLWRYWWRKNHLSSETAWDAGESSLFCGVTRLWYYTTDVSGQPIIPTVKGEAIFDCKDVSH